MTETPHNPESKTSDVPTSEYKNTRRKALPWWLWALLGALLIAAIAVFALPLLTANNPDVAPSASPTPSSSVKPSPTPTETMTPTPTPTEVGQGTFDSDMYNYLSDTLNSQNTSVLAQGGTFSNPVRVVVANSGQDSNLSPDDAVTAMAYMFTPMDPNPWDLALSDSVLASYRSGPFGQFFPEGAIVARSSDGHVFSFIGHDNTITTMFMSVSDDYLK